MSTRTRNILLFLGIGISLVLLGLRIMGQLNGSQGGVGMFSGLLGYEGQKNYAVIYIEQNKAPLLFLLNANEGKFTLQSAIPAGDFIKHVPASNFQQAADFFIERIVSSKLLPSVDAVGFVTSGAAGEVVDAFRGFYLEDAQVNSGSLSSTVSELITSSEKIKSFNSTASLRASNILTRGRELLSATKQIFAQKQAAVYFKSQSPFGKPCIGACGSEIFELLKP